jgi:hypothetical protein
VKDNVGLIARLVSASWTLIRVSCVSGHCLSLFLRDVFKSIQILDIHSNQGYHDI